MKKITRKTPNRKDNVLNLFDNPKFKIKQASNELYSHTTMRDVFQFRAGDKIICRDYLGEELSSNALVIAETDTSEKSLTTAANAVKVLSIVVAYQREVPNG